MFCFRGFTTFEGRISVFDDAGGYGVIYQCWKSCLFVATGNGVK